MLKPHTIAYVFGYSWACNDLLVGHDFSESAQQRFPKWPQDERVEWQRGYEDAIMAYRVGSDYISLAKEGIFGISRLTEAALLESILDSKISTKPDPRKE